MKKNICCAAIIAMLFALSFSVHAQQPAKAYKIGVLDPGGPMAAEERWGPFRRTLRELGYVENQHITFEYRYADGKSDRLAELAAELVGRNVDIIVASSGVAALAAKNATTSIPVVMEAGDPVGFGLVASLARRGGNVTGLSSFAPDLAGKRLELLKEVLPKLARVALLWNSSAQFQQAQVSEIEVAARAFGVSIHRTPVQTSSDFDRAFSTMRKERVQALMVTQAPFFSDERRKIVDLAVKYRLPAMYGNKQIADAGGLMFYGIDADQHFSRMAIFVDKILRGTKPADIPVEQPMRFEFIVNLKTAKEIGVTIPPNVLVRAQRVIR